ncbi:NAD-dependent epimerase/dehydratase family protein [Pseudalkalibacillus salsuginis]|uniref:NAD-dependent epimerase/dehydratase family protein n=1 Tax=Pseudalkalibacillus salsuginis TaxID=2910972 RepID=UPI001F2EECFD|nr:NAD-dependent epimerase/dehydratase family protein [Pseudalkalibacillus salsuginis]MCF6409173.1 NAD-dependent epimerase/dehydratase family protein [Pseudalkalibacillus salsuginis]
MKVLITGGCGFIGSHIAELLAAQGYEVVVIDNLSSGNYRSDIYPIHYYEIDFTSMEMEGIFEKERPEFVIHLAAQVDIKTSMENPVFDAEINILGTIRLLQMCRIHEVKRFIFASTSAVYGDLGGQSADEASSLNPISFYGISKLASEKYIQQFNQQFGLPFTIFRYSNVYGPRQRSDNEGGVVPIFIKLLTEGRIPVIYGDGKQTRDFIHVEDVARANLSAIEKNVDGVMNISSMSDTTINRLYKLISGFFRYDKDPLYLPNRHGDILFSRLVNKKAETRLGWKPRLRLEEGICQMIQTVTVKNREGTDK